MACAGEPDLPAVHALQDATTLEPADATAQPDDQGDQLTYTLRLDPPPPVGAFWSLTMYDIPHFFLVANDINRYSLGDRTPGIVFADDGSLTITLSHARPGDPTAALNWLPAPAGGFPPGPANVRARTRGAQPDLHRPAHHPILIRRTHPLTNLLPRYSR